MSIERNFDVSFVADLALREKQIQQDYRPIIAVHKRFARRGGGTLFRAQTRAHPHPARLNHSRRGLFAGRSAGEPSSSFDFSEAQIDTAWRAGLDAAQEAMPWTTGALRSSKG